MNQPIHVAITRRIKPGCEQEFQTALKEFFANSLAQTGVRGAAMVVASFITGMKCWHGPSSVAAAQSPRTKSGKVDRTVKHVPRSQPGGAGDQSRD